MASDAGEGDTAKRPRRRKSGKSNKLQRTIRVVVGVSTERLGKRDGGKKGCVGLDALHRGCRIWGWGTNLKLAYSSIYFRAIRRAGVIHCDERHP